MKHCAEAVIAYLFYGFFYLLPIRWASALGGAIAKRIGPHLKVTQTARTNITRAMPQTTPEDIEAIILNMWDNLGRTVGEFPHLRKLNNTRFKQHVTVQGQSILDTIKKSGRQVIFFSAHQANWESGPKTMAMLGMPLSLVYRRANNPWVDRLINFNRTGYQNEKIPKGTIGARYLLKALKEGRPIGILLDQKMNDGIAVPFFGIPAMTAPAVANLARRSDCAVVPVQVVRKPGVTFEVTIHPPIDIPKDGKDDEDIYEIMLNINQIFEEWITAHPDQWFWVHKRWPKTS